MITGEFGKCLCLFSSWLLNFLYLWSSTPNIKEKYLFKTKCLVIFSLQATAVERCAMDLQLCLSYWYFSNCVLKSVWLLHFNIREWILFNLIPTKLTGYVNHQGGIESAPTQVPFKQIPAPSFLWVSSLASAVQWLRRYTSSPKVPSSNPGAIQFFFSRKCIQEVKIFLFLHSVIRYMFE